MSDFVKIPYAGLVRILGTRPFLTLGEKMIGFNVPIFVLHRFACTSLGINGHDPIFVRWALEYLRRKKFNFVSVEDVVKCLRGECTLPSRPVAVSVDDGFWDQAAVGARLFAEFDCPATYFVTTGFINKENWFWGSKVEFLLDQCDYRNTSRLHLDLDNSKEWPLRREVLEDEMIRALKLKSLDCINSTLNDWARELDVELPEEAPDKFAPASWASLRDLQKRGMKIGPHTYSHPILSRQNSNESRDEIARSASDLSNRLGQYSNVFCYPVGRAEDFGLREQRFAEDHGFLGAVSAIPGSVDWSCRRQLFSIPRFGFPNTKKDLIQYASWIEAVKSRFRS
ncbi:polysaccharide deacetylase family protein [Lentisalinibacter sediminis]|uniref:polysaccharide deacetylase family protein n=1 Tax=Lentisalinibacter sediminis TaxID=2992237 RepID=UPI003868FAF6